MLLKDEETAMLAGQFGAVPKLALTHQIKVGEFFGAQDFVAVTQAQESVASAELDYINSVFAHNVAKLSLARAIGNTPESLRQFLKFP